MKKAGEEVRRETSKEEEDWSLSKKKSKSTVGGKSTGKAVPADQTVEQAADQWYNQALESTTIHLVRAVCTYGCFAWLTFLWINNNCRGQAKGASLRRWLQPFVW